MVLIFISINIKVCYQISAFSPIIKTNTETKKIETKKETYMKIEIQIKLAIQIQKKCQPIFLMFRFWRGFF